MFQSSIKIGKDKVLNLFKQNYKAIAYWISIIIINLRRDLLYLNSAG
jgi:hypothetical protein